jgi:hypothetical protein
MRLNRLGLNDTGIAITRLSPWLPAIDKDHIVPPLLQSKSGRNTDHTGSKNDCVSHGSVPSLKSGKIWQKTFDGREPTTTRPHQSI